MHIVVSGSTGLIGTALVSRLRADGHTVVRLVRSKPTGTDVVWDAASGRLDPVVLGEALAISKACTVFIAVGTSLRVQPAAGLAGVAADHGARLIVVNAEPTPYDDIADDVIREPIGTALPRLLRTLAKENA